MACESSMGRCREKVASALPQYPGSCPSLPPHPSLLVAQLKTGPTALCSTCHGFTPSHAFPRDPSGARAGTRERTSRSVCSRSSPSINNPNKGSQRWHGCLVLQGGGFVAKSSSPLPAAAATRWKNPSPNGDHLILRAENTFTSISSSPRHRMFSSLVSPP